MSKKELALASTQGNLSPEERKQLQKEERRQRAYERSFDKAEEAVARKQGAVVRRWLQLRLRGRSASQLMVAATKELLLMWRS